ncbi:hypothetical protein OIU77_016762 [Salix suchowensis]|uniref:Uncharacterized protein n=1 Tax=Salix suchowensis TaxID=1278906 RepID=A0ABQ8ZLX3_9ROSI|nr:hypothetical protein OIU77_016762 [Salix suchowensis]
MAAACLIDATRSGSCRDTQAATHLKLISILIIFLTSIIGISFPVILARYFHGKALYDKATLIIKCFAAGVILSTSLVHVLPDAYDALSDCHVASKHPWKDFPFAGLVTLIGVLLALLVDLTASAHMEQHGHGNGNGNGEYTVVGIQEEMVGKKDSDASVKVEIVGEVDLVKAGFSFGTVAYMCFMFAVTTPMGIVLGMIVFSMTGYDDSNPNALIMEGLMGSLSSGILVYMGLVDLIAADFFHNKLMSSAPWLKKASFIALALGSTSMSILALWA